MVGRKHGKDVAHFLRVLSEPGHELKGPLEEEDVQTTADHCLGAVRR